MRLLTIVWSSTASALSVGVLSASLCSAAPIYTVSLLSETSTTFTYSVGWDLNSLGQVVGYGRQGDRDVGFVWSPGSGPQPLAYQGANFTYASAINGAGVIAGSAVIDGAHHPVIWPTDSAAFELPGLTTTQTEGTLQDIDDLGRVAGATVAGTGSMIWDLRFTAPSVFQFPPGGMVYGLREDGAAAGVQGGNNATFWDSFGVATDLGDLPGGEHSSVAFDLNSNGQVVGFGTTGNPQPGNRAFLWERETGMIDLGDLDAGWDDSRAYGINEEGLVVGSSAGAGNIHDPFRAFVWSPIFGMLDLNELAIDLPSGWILTRAEEINDSGQIVGNAVSSDGSRGTVFLATPVPEPALSLLLVCILAFVVQQRAQNCDGGRASKNRNTN